HGAGRDLQGRLARLAGLRSSLPPDLPEPARQDGRLRPLLRHERAAGELRDRPRRPRGGDLPRRARPAVPRPGDRARAQHMRAARLLRPIALTSALLAAMSSPALAATPRTSLPVIERQVMCVTCKIPLNVAQSPQADRERAFIQSLIDEGRGEAQVKDALVAQYGQAVLALPSDSGFDATAYIVPLAALIVLLAVLAALLPRWRRRARVQARDRAAAPALGAADAKRLQEDIERFD